MKEQTQERWQDFLKHFLNEVCLRAKIGIVYSNDALGLSTFKSIELYLISNLLDEGSNFY
jgi:hypothetical protein